jgi:hypothetical protein
MEHIRGSQDEMKAMMEKHAEMQKEKNEAKNELRSRQKLVDENEEKIK